MNKLYCPKCEYQIPLSEDEDNEEGIELFCQNCLSWSTICTDPNPTNDEFYLEFSRYDTRWWKYNASKT